jgi:hypothetical protein
VDDVKIWRNYIGVSVVEIEYDVNPSEAEIVDGPQFAPAI